MPLVSVQAMLLTDASEKLDSMSLLFYMSSFSVLLLLPTTLLLEPGSFAQAGGAGVGWPDLSHSRRGPATASLCQSNMY